MCVNLRHQKIIEMLGTLGFTLQIASTQERKVAVKCAKVNKIQKKTKPKNKKPKTSCGSNSPKWHISNNECISIENKFLASTL